MRPSFWQPPVDPSADEQAIIKRIRRAKLFVFLRQHRHELFDEAFQEELAQLYEDSPLGQPPIAPAQLALAIILQAYMGVSDDEVIEATTMDRRLIERTIEVAATTGAFGSRPLRAALDSSPLWGASRVEDTYNLLGHALRKALGVIARQQGRGLAEVANEAGASLLSGSSLKAALDLDWDNPTEQAEALSMILGVLTAVEVWLGTHPQESEIPAVQQSMATAQQVKQQDVQVTETGTAGLRKGVAKDRRISVEDAQMRHGRKSRSVRVDGYKRHVLHDLDTGLVRAVGMTSANAAEATVTESIRADLACQRIELSELHIDRAYLSSTWVRERSADLAVYCKAWPVRNGTRFLKTAFQLDWERLLIRCPNSVELPFEPGGAGQFPPETCPACPLRQP